MSSASLVPRRSMTAADLNTAGLIAFVAALALPCACEESGAHGIRRECVAAPLSRWWEAICLTPEQLVALERRRQRTRNEARFGACGALEPKAEQSVTAPGRVRPRPRALERVLSADQDAAP